MSRRIVEQFITAALDLIYPASLYCICCGKIIDASRPYRLCNECMESIPWANDRTCRTCGKPLSAHDPNDVCYSCRAHDHRYDRGFTCCEYGESARSMIFALKYGGRPDIGETMAEIMHDRLDVVRQTEGLRYDRVAAIPMYARKERLRGYNQAAVIARSLARREGAPFDSEALIRVRETTAMRGLTPLERQSNIAGAFAVGSEEELAGCRVLVVDDIYTTGATADAAAEVLRQAGAQKVYIMTFAAGADVIKTE